MFADLGVTGPLHLRFSADLTLHTKIPFRTATRSFDYKTLGRLGS
jgi:hypothetical protein